jgi:hypothetical protein
MNEELQRAKALLARHGYAVIPREQIKSIGAFHSTPDRKLMAQAEFEVLKHTRYAIFRTMAEELSRHDWVRIDARREPERPGVTTYIATLQLIPHKWDADPFLEMIRRTE